VQMPSGRSDRRKRKARRSGPIARLLQEVDGARVQSGLLLSAEAALGATMSRYLDSVIKRATAIHQGSEATDINAPHLLPVPADDLRVFQPAGEPPNRGRFPRPTR
jgi:hypothetical protein